MKGGNNEVGSEIASLTKKAEKEKKRIKKPLCCQSETKNYHPGMSLQLREKDCEYLMGWLFTCEYLMEES